MYTDWNMHYRIINHKKSFFNYRKKRGVNLEATSSKIPKIDHPSALCE